MIKKYYQKNKEKLQKEACERTRTFVKKKKKKGPRQIPKSF